MALNFAQQRKAAAKRAAQIGALSDGPSFQSGYGVSPTNYKGESSSFVTDIIDSGGPNQKGTIVNAPNKAFSRQAYDDDLATRALKAKKGGH